LIRNCAGPPPSPRNAHVRTRFRSAGLCERKRWLLRRSEIAAANAPCETSRSGAGEQLRIQKTAGLKSVRSACGICVGLRRQARGRSCGD
jgi:hypothetical protein